MGLIQNQYKNHMYCIYITHLCMSILDNYICPEAVLNLKNIRPCGGIVFCLESYAWDTLADVFLCSLRQSAYTVENKLRLFCIQSPYCLENKWMYITKTIQTTQDTTCICGLDYIKYRIYYISGLLQVLKILQTWLLLNLFEIKKATFGHE